MAKTVIGQFLQDLITGVASNGKVVFASAKTTAENEGTAQALQLIFDGKPNYWTDNTGKTTFQWQGNELQKARARVNSFASMKGGNTSVDFVPVLLPLVMKTVLPFAILGGVWIYLSSHENKNGRTR